MNFSFFDQHILLKCLIIIDYHDRTEVTLFWSLAEVSHHCCLISLLTKYYHNQEFLVRKLSCLSESQLFYFFIKNYRLQQSNSQLCCRRNCCPLRDLYLSFFYQMRFLEIQSQNIDKIKRTSQPLTVLASCA